MSWEVGIPGKAGVGILAYRMHEKKADKVQTDWEGGIYVVKMNFPDGECRFVIVYLLMLTELCFRIPYKASKV